MNLKLKNCRVKKGGWENLITILSERAKSTDFWDGACWGLLTRCLNSLRRLIEHQMRQRETRCRTNFEFRFYFQTHNNNNIYPWYYVLSRERNPFALCLLQSHCAEDSALGEEFVCSNTALLCTYQYIYSVYAHKFCVILANSLRHFGSQLSAQFHAIT